MNLSIIICTYNRQTILVDCLESFSKQNAPDQRFEILIVDNNSTDQTKEVVAHYCRKHANFYYLFEPRQGLSHARNYGLQQARFPWVGYVDDDAKVSYGYVSRALYIIDNYAFDGFGGDAHSWFKAGRPKWLPADHDQAEKVAHATGPVEIRTSYLIGGNMFFKKQLLLHIGGFPLDKGMTGSRVAYAEETVVQQKLRAQGYTLGYDPELVVDHLFTPHKYQLMWHIKAYYARGRDAAGIFYDHYTLFQLFKDLSWILFITLPKSLLSWFFKSGYYWQNAVLDVFRPTALYLGKFFGARTK